MICDNSLFNAKAESASDGSAGAKTMCGRCFTFWLLLAVAVIVAFSLGRSGK